MIRLAAVAPLLAVGLGCSMTAECAELAQVLGRWEMTPPTAEKLPPGCRHAGFEITMTTVTGFSGESLLVASYVPVESQSGLLLRLTLLSHNGEDNCQGIPANYVIENFQREMEIDIVDGYLRLYMPTRASGNYLELVRSDSRQHDDDA
jgi:hypothetical protein